MKNSIYIIATFIVFPIVFTSCDKSPENQEQAERSLVEAKREIGISRAKVTGEIQTFRIEMAGKIMENNRSIAEIKKRVQRENDSVRVLNEARITTLQIENREMKRIIDNYADLSRHNWDEFKIEFTNDMDELGHSLKNFFENSDTAK